MANIYVITSGKGGVGKTTAAAAIGAGLAAAGKRVALIWIARIKSALEPVVTLL